MSSTITLTLTWQRLYIPRFVYVLAIIPQNIIIGLKTSSETLSPMVNPLLKNENFTSLKAWLVMCCWNMPPNLKPLLELIKFLAKIHPNTHTRRHVMFEVLGRTCPPPP